MEMSKSNSVYTREEEKRRNFYNIQKSYNLCGVDSSIKKPWYCGEFMHCCSLCNNYYVYNKKNEYQPKYKFPRRG